MTDDLDPRRVFNGVRILRARGLRAHSFSTRRVDPTRFAEISFSTRRDSVCRKGRINVKDRALLHVITPLPDAAMVPFISFPFVPLFLSRRSKNRRCNVEERESTR